MLLQKAIKHFLVWACRLLLLLWRVMNRKKKRILKHTLIQTVAPPTASAGLGKRSPLWAAGFHGRGIPREATWKRKEQGCQRVKGQMAFNKLKRMIFHTSNKWIHGFYFNGNYLATVLSRPLVRGMSWRRELNKLLELLVSEATSVCISSFSSAKDDTSDSH